MSAVSETVGPGRGFLRPPRTRLGGWGLALGFAFFILMVVFFALVAAGQRGGDTFFSNLWLTVPILLAGAAGIAGGVAAAIAIVRDGERSIFSFAGVLLGAIVIFWTVAELIGHDEPGPPEGVLGVEELLDDPVYGEEIQVYGDVEDLGELLCPCFTLRHRDESIVVWYDLMSEGDEPARPAVDVSHIENGDTVIVTGELLVPGPAQALHDFWSSAIELED